MHQIFNIDYGSKEIFLIKSFLVIKLHYFIFNIIKRLIQKIL